MKQFYLRFFLISTIFLSGYFCPFLADGQNNNDGEDPLDTSSPGLFATSSDQQTTSTQIENDGTALFAGPPPGTGGTPIGGVTPISHGFSFLIGLSLFYLLYIATFNFIKKKKMNKSIIAFFVLLGGAIIQTYGQIPSGAILIRNIDFGSGSITTPPQPAQPATAASILASEGVETKFTSFAWTTTGTNRLGADSYMLVQTINGSSGVASWAFPVWWGYPTSGTNVTTTQANNSLKDHTGKTGGYYMVTNTDLDTVSYIMRFSIGKLCPNSNLYLSVYLGNLVISTAGTTGGPGSTTLTYTNPKLRFAVVDARSIDANAANPAIPVDTIYRYSMPDEVPKNTPTASPLQYPQWNQYGFTFSNKTDSIVLLVYNNQPSSVGNDLAMDDVELYIVPVHVPVSSISSPSFYFCDGLPMDLAGSYDDPSESFENHAEFMWLYSQYQDFRDSTYVSADSVCRAPAAAGWYKVVIGAEGNTNTGNASIGSKSATYNNLCASVSEPVEVKMIPPSTVLYWSPVGTSQDWNDFRNWKYENGAAAAYPPNMCTNVHIPGNTNSFPSLYIDAQGDSSACNYIKFHFGGLIGQPQLLKYDSAYVQYNFGNSIDPYSVLPAMDRDSRWYALAAPLQKMASGDFGFCGFPTVWQERFSSTVQSDGYESLGTGYYGAWYVPENINSWDLGSQYNAITLWVQADSPNLTTGLDATGRGALKGILEVPFYQNSIDSVYHRGFSHKDNTSYFQYYYSDQPQAGYPLIDPAVKTPGSIDRGSNGEAYRFAFEGAPFIPSTTKGIFSMDIPTPANEAAGMVMIGNPFMSDFDFAIFAADNGNDFSGYYTYNGDNFSTFSPYTTSDQYIAPLQAFFIEPTVTRLKFNANTEAVAPKTNIPVLRSSAPDSGAKADVMIMTASSAAGSSRVTLSMQDINAKSLPLLLMKGYSDIPAIYAVDAAGQRNAIQFEGGYVDTIPLGVYSSNSADPITLTVSEKDKLSVNYLQLVDKYTNTTIDLLKTDTYTYTNVPNTPDRFLLKMNYKSITGISPAESLRPVTVRVSNNMLYVSSGVAIEDVSVITLQGITVVKDSNIGRPTYAKSLELPAGLYLVSVKVKTGQTSVAKVVVK